MEKRLLLAFLLSFLVLVVWGRFNKAEKGIPEADLARSVADTRGADEMVHRGSGESGISPDATDVAISAQFDEKIFTLENENLIVEISNVGAVIKKITLKRFEVTLPVKKIIEIKELKNKEFSVISQNSDELVLGFQDENWQIREDFTLVEDEYLVHHSVDMEPKGDVGQNFSLDINAFTVDASRLDDRLAKSRDRSLLEYSVSIDKKVTRKGNAYQFKEKDEKTKSGTVDWVGFRSRYYGMIIKPLYETDGYRTHVKDLENLEMQITTKPSILAPQQALRLEYQIFYGPQKLGLLAKYGEGFEKLMAFSNFGILDGIAKLIYKVMHFIHKFIPNWGVSILLISFMIYGAMYPLTMKGMVSMRRMQKLQPKIKEMQTKYKNDPQRLNKEMMQFYKANKINPLGGCLPLLLQMPIFIGLYQVLWRSVSFQGANFLWIKDLSQPDRLIMLDFSLPFIGNEINVLPLAMIVVMAFQQRLSARNMVTADPAQRTQQKMMMFLFPVFIGFIFYKFPSGLTLYFTVFYLLSTFTQWKISRMKTE